MQLKLFQYKQVEEPAQPEAAPKRRGCCCGRLFVTACLIALLITFTAFVVPQLYSTVDEDALDSASEEVVDLLAKVELKGLQRREQLNDALDAMDREAQDAIKTRMENMEALSSVKGAERKQLKVVLGIKDDADKCAGVRSCLVDYYGLWDIDASDVLPPYVDFFAKLQSNFESLHEFAIDLICLAQDEAKNCMAAELAEKSNDIVGDIEQCLSVQGWMENFELKKLDAREYAADFRVRGFECRNEKFLKEHFKCIYPTTQSRKEDLAVCSADLKKAIASHQPVCDAMDDYISCSRSIFVEECGQKVSNFICNIVETNMLFNYPSCRPDFQRCESFQ